MAAPEECPWQRHFDDNGVPFYYNEATEESEWDVPPAWKDHFDDLDKQQAAAADGDADAGAGSDAVENGHAADSGEEQGKGEMDAERAAAAEQRQVDDAEGAQALLGLAQAAGDQHDETPQGRDQQETGGTQDDGLKPMDEDQGSASPLDQEGERQGAGSTEGSRAGSFAGGTTPPHDGTPTAHDDEMGNGEHDHDHAHETNRTSEEDTYAPADGAASCPWIKSFDEESKTYFYYNEVTEESSWDKPAEYERFHTAQERTADATAAADSDEHSEEEYFQERSPEEQGEDSGAYGDAAASPRYSDPEEEEEDEEDGRRPSRSPSSRPTDHRPSSAASRQTRSRSRKDSNDSNRGSTNNDKSSPSPEMGLPFPSFGDDYSPNHDGEWQVNDEDDPEGGKASGSPRDGSSGGATPFGVSTSPESEELGSAPRTPGFAVGELSPVVDHGGVNSAAGGDGQEPESREAAGERVAGKKKSEAVGTGEGKAQLSEAKLAQKVESAEREVAECERRLEETDAIMEVDFNTRVTAYQTARERLQQLKDGAVNRQALLKETRNAGVKKLVAGYKGYAQQASLVNNWLQLATDGEEDTENLMLKQLKMLIKTNFDAKKVDTLLDSSMPGWLTAMQDDDGWRHTLIELAREHRASALLRFVLKQLSDMGYHREIASVINQTDLFSVFNGVLKDALARIPGGDEVEAIEALADLKRMCCSTSYMFMYSQQLLIDLERAAVEESRKAASALESANKVNGSGGSNGGSRKRGRQEASQPPASPSEVSGNKEAEAESGSDGGDWGRTAAARKYKRLRQELAKHMYVVGGRADSNSSSPDGGRGPSGFSFGRSISSIGIGSGGVGGSSRSELNGGIGTEDDGAAGASSGAPTGGFLRGVEMGLSLRLPPPAGSAAEKSAKAASDAVVSLLGQAGGGGARRTGVVSEAVETLVSSFRLKSVVRAANQDAVGAAAAAVKAAAEQDAKYRRPPAYLLRHPTVMDIFLEALFHPSHRSPSEDLRAGCCALLAYASCVEVPVLDTGGSGGGDDVAGTGGEDNQTETVDLPEVAEASHALMQAAGECFVTSQLASLQGRLRPFAKHPLVSLGVLRWVHAQVSTEAFVSTPSFLSYAPVFLKLCGQAADEHPPQRPETFEIMKLMLSASTAPDTPPAAKAKLKQHVLLRMADLVVKGYMLPVLRYLRHLATGSGLDPTLVGYFLVKIVGVAIPRSVARGGIAKSYSPAFLNAMAGLMGVQRVRQALIALKPVDRERFGGYARYCLKFQREDLTAEAREWMKQLQVGLERA